MEGKGGNKAGRTNTYPKLPDRFRIRSPDSSPAPQPSEEEVIFFWEETPTSSTVHQHAACQIC